MIYYYSEKSSPTYVTASLARGCLWSVCYFLGEFIVVTRMFLRPKIEVEGKTRRPYVNRIATRAETLGLLQYAYTCTCTSVTFYRPNSSLPVRQTPTWWNTWWTFRCTTIFSIKRKENFFNANKLASKGEAGPKRGPTSPFSIHKRNY